MNCPSCSHSNLEGAVRCEMCGHDLAIDGDGGEASWATMAMPVPQELLEAAAKAAAEVHADLAESEAQEKEEDGGMGATMGMQAVPAELLNLSIDPETGEFTGVGGDTQAASKSEDPQGTHDDAAAVGTERTMFEQPAISEALGSEEPGDESPPEAAEPVAADGAATENSDPAEVPPGSDDAPVTRSQLRTIVLAAVGLGILAMLVPLIMSMSSGGRATGSKTLAIHSFPSHTNAIGNLSLSRLRTTWVFNEYGEKALALAFEKAGTDAFKEDFGVDLSQVDVIAAGVQVGHGNTPEPLLALQGRFDSKTVESALRGSLGDLEAGAPGAVSDGAFYGKLAQATGMVDDQTILRGSVGMIAAAVAARGGSASVGTHAGLMSAIQQVNAEALLWGGVQITRELLANARESLPSDFAGAFAEGDALAFSLEVEESVVIQVAYFATDETRATELGTRISSAMAQAKLLTKTGAPALTEAIEAVETRREGPVVNLTAILPRAVAERVMKSFGGAP